MRIIYFLITILISVCAFSQNLGVEYVNYSNGQLLNSTNLPNGRIETAFTITNYGSSILNSNDQVYCSARINGTYYKLDLTSTGSTPITPGQTVAVNGSFTKNSGYLDGPLSLAFLNTNVLEVCVVVYGVGAASVNNNFPNDPEPCNNMTCVMYSNTLSSYSNDCIFTNLAQDQSNESTILMYPQPADDNITFDFKIVGSIVDRMVVSDLTGNVLSEIKVENNQSVLSVATYPAGMYYASIFSGDQQIAVKKLVIE